MLRCSELFWHSDCTCWMDDPRRVCSVSWNNHSSLRASVVRDHGEAGKSERSSQQLPHFCSYGLCLGCSCGEPRSVGCLDHKLARHLGRLAPRVDRRVPGHNGLCRRAAGPSCLFWYAFAIQHETHVRGTVASRHRMSSTRQLRNPCLSGFRPFRVVLASDFRNYRDDCGDGFRGEHACHIRTAPTSDGGVTYRETT
jgi:hypothetical protein